MDKETSTSDGWQKYLQILAVSLPISGVFLYIIGYAYYWGGMEAYGLSPLDFPLEFDGYIAMAFLAVATIFNKITEFFDWASVLAHNSFFIEVYLVIIIVLALVIKYDLNLKDKEVSVPSMLINPLEKVAGFFYPVKEMIFLPYMVIAGYFVLFAMVSLLLLFPLSFFMVGNIVATGEMNSFSCDNEAFKCVVIETEKQVFTGKIIVRDKDMRMLFDGSRLSTIQAKDILSETYSESKVE